MTQVVSGNEEVSTSVATISELDAAITADIASVVDAQRRAATSTAALLSERQTSDLREQFIAVLGHDLRNPLASIASGVVMLRQQHLSDKGVTILAHMQNSVQRMEALINDMLDFARGRLGGGFRLARDPNAPLSEVLHHVIDELHDAFPSYRIETHIDLTLPVNCDGNRIAQLASNLVENALKHGREAGTVRVSASTDEREFELTVANEGDPIDPAVLDRLFLPFVRASHDSAPQGLGLGLYIASQIAAAHGGELAVDSSIAETRFTLRIPRK